MRTVPKKIVALLVILPALVIVLAAFVAGFVWEQVSLGWHAGRSVEADDLMDWAGR